MKENSPKTVEAIGKLGGMMHYMLDEGVKEKVNLVDEIDYISNFIQLQKLRISLESDIDIMFKIEGNPDDYIIAPMLIIPFIENAFKHGLSIRNPSFIHVVLNIQDEFELIVKNSIHSDVDNLKGNGFGLKNVKQRLDLIYGDKHHLNIHETGDEFIVKLGIALDNK